MHVCGSQAGLLRGATGREVLPWWGDLLVPCWAAAFDAFEGSSKSCRIKGVGSAVRCILSFRALLL